MGNGRQGTGEGAWRIITNGVRTEISGNKKEFHFWLTVPLRVQYIIFSCRGQENNYIGVECGMMGVVVFRSTDNGNQSISTH